MSHGKTICKICKVVISQCRCMAGCHNIKDDVCSNCKKVWGIKDQLNTPKEKEQMKKLREDYFNGV